MGSCTSIKVLLLFHSRITEGVPHPRRLPFPRLAALGTVFLSSRSSVPPSPPRYSLLRPHHHDLFLLLLSRLFARSSPALVLRSLREPKYDGELLNLRTFLPRLTGRLRRDRRRRRVRGRTLRQ